MLQMKDFQVIGSANNVICGICTTHERVLKTNV